ncbi:MAG: DUF4292 domain-containing protein [Muribaculaceae bacterium]|nr:DUF4292 domain-containing protein [Muribaculaceae bacterium]
MKSKSLILLSLISATLLMTTSCGTIKKGAAATLPQGQGTTPTTTVTGDPLDAVIASLGNWQTMQTGGNIKLSAGSSFSSSIQVRMVRDKDIYISLRPVLGIEVGKLLITADSIYAVDKVHKRYIAEKVSLLTAGVPVTVSDVQDIFLGRAFIIGKGTLNDALKPQVTAEKAGSGIAVTPNEHYKGHVYSFNYDKSNNIVTLNIMPEGSATATYQVKYADVKATDAGKIAHDIKVNATVEKKKLDLTLTYKNIDWNGNVKIEHGIPSGYTRMSARDLFSMFSN